MTLGEKKGGIARKLILYVILFSSLITLISTAVQLHSEYQHDIEHLNRHIAQIETGYKPAVTSAVWSADWEQVGVMLESIEKLSDIEYVEVLVDGKSVMSTGLAPESKYIANSFPLQYPYRSRIQDIGEMKIVASLSGVYQSLIDRIWIILASNTIKTFLVAFFIYFLFYKFVTRHLIRISEFFNSQEFEKYEQKFELDRNKYNQAPDEIDALVNSLNTMQDKLRTSVSELRENEEQLRLLSAHFEEIKEEERTSIARDIHDELGQSLIALNIDTHWLIEQLDGQPVLKEKAQAMLQIMDETVESVNHIIADLRPPLLDEIGLDAAISLYARKFQERSGILCAVKCENFHKKLGNREAIVFFRVMQEALTNIYKHADAKKALIILRIVSGTLIMIITDDGTGFDVNDSKNVWGFGLLGMKERALSINGEIDISSSPGNGAIITLTLVMNHL
jgi:signal transduction histidine kinase